MPRGSAASTRAGNSSGETCHVACTRQEAYETTRLPVDLDYRRVHGLSIEAQQKLNQHRPETLGQAARISGITPAAISLLLVHLKRGFGAAQKTA